MKPNNSLVILHLHWLMPMRMMHVGHMRMLMTQTLMSMEMRVRLSGWIIR